MSHSQRRQHQRENGRWVRQTAGWFTPPPLAQNILEADLMHLTRESNRLSLQLGSNLWPSGCKTVSNFWLSETHVHVSARKGLHKPEPTEINTHTTHAYRSAGRIYIKQTTSYKHYTDKGKHTAEHIYHVCVCVCVSSHTNIDTHTHMYLYTDRRTSSAFTCFLSVFATSAAL